jgi:pimeloyl-ACP methyl ester carboxylesterase
MVRAYNLYVRRHKVIDQRASWRSEALGPSRTLELAQGRVRCHDTGGEGPPVVFVHGLLVNANLWRKVVPRLAGERRCVTLDMPLGAHLEPLPNAQLTPPELADIVAGAIEELGLGPVTLVGNDTGGAVCQLVATRHPDLIDRLVLTSCDAYDNFPPKIFAFLAPLSRAPGLIPYLFAPLRLRAPRRLPIAFGWVTKRPIDRDAEDSYVLPVFQSKGVRADLGKLIKGIDTRYTMEAAEQLRSFHRPVLLAWSAEDKLFPRTYAERLRDDLPEARLEWVQDSYTFSAEDNPERVAELIAGFAPGVAASAAEQSSSETG